MKVNKISIAFLLLIVLGSCQDFDTLVKNPNLPTAVPPSLLLTGLLNGLNEENAWDGIQGSQGAAQFWIGNYTYYGTNNYDQSPFIGSNFNYLKLQNVVQMEAEAIRAGGAEVNPYTAIGNFLRAYHFNLMLQKYGDLPVTKALKGSEAPTPEYDTQKAGFIQVLKWLDESNTEFSQLITRADASLAGDVFLNNDLSKWQKVVNSFTLRVLISLSKKEADTDLNIKQKFSAIVGNPVKYPVMTSLGDNLQYTYNAQFNNYPKNPGSRGFDIARENVASTFLELTTSLKDPRTFIAASPAPAEIAGGKSYTDFTAYVGANAADDMGTLGVNAQAGKYSFVNALRYYATYDGASAEPAIMVGYPELCFNIAEGINRGWATGAAGAWYNKGIVASMAHLGIVDGASGSTTIKVGNNLYVPYGDVTVSVSGYLAQPVVQYKGDNANGLVQILNQKYLAFWQNSNWEAFFNMRRTGVPAFKTGLGTGNGGKIPMRWQYPFSERTANATNYSSSVQSQFGGSDNLNGVLWINK